MPAIPKRERTQSFAGGGAGTQVRPIEGIPTDVAADETVIELGNQIVERSLAHQKESDNNLTNEKINSYQSSLIPAMEIERNKTGKDTDGNLDRYSKASTQLRTELMTGVPPRIADDINSRLEKIDLNHEIELSRVRSVGLKQESKQNHLNAEENSKKSILGNPNFALSEISKNAEMYMSDVELGTLNAETAKEKIRNMADEMATTAIISIGDKQGPEAQLQVLESGIYSKFISADKEAKFKEDAVKLEKAIEKQRVVDEARAKKDAEDARNESIDKFEDQFLNKLQEGTLTIPEVLSSTLHPTSEGYGAGKEHWITAIEGQSKGELTKTNWEEYNSIRTDLYNENIDNWSPSLINARVKKGGISIGGKGSEAGAKELIDIYNAEKKKGQGTNPKLGIIMKEVKAAADSGIFVDDFSGSEEDRQLNAVRHANIAQRINDRVAKGEDASEVFLDEMAPYRGAKSKKLLDRFFQNVVQLSHPFGIGTTIAQGLKEKGEKISPLEGQKAGRYKIDGKIVKWDGTKVIQ